MLPIQKKNFHVDKGGVLIHMQKSETIMIKREIGYF